ncbi:hypothetical protein LguiB_017782 [Lonicera macranthoides]
MDDGKTNDGKKGSDDKIKVHELNPKEKESKTSIMGGHIREVDPTETHENKMPQQGIPNTENKNGDESVRSETSFSSPKQFDMKSPLRLITWQPSFDISYVRRLEYNRAGLSSRDVAHNAVVSQLKFENHNAHMNSRQLEERLNIRELTVNRQKHEVNREKENSRKLEYANQQLRQKIGWLERDIVAKERELTISKLAVKISLETTSHVFEVQKPSPPDVPSLEILSQGTLEGPKETSEGATKESNGPSKSTTPVVKDVRPDTITWNDIYALMTKGPVTTKDNTDICLVNYREVYAQMEKMSGIHSFIYDALLGSLDVVGKIFIPICHKKNFHFMLMYMNTNEGIWYHLNPFNKRHSGPNVCYEDAMKMHVILEAFFKDIKDNREDMLDNGTIKSLSAKR